MDSCSALPIVENESIATFGSMPVISVSERAEAIAMLASSSAVGIMMRPQSAKITGLENGSPSSIRK